LENLFERDLKIASYHEAGHLTVIRHFGGNGFVLIKPTFTNDIKFEKAFIGHVEFQNISENPMHRALIGSAGFISECILAGLDINDALDLWDTDYHDLSDSDKKFTLNMSDDLFCEAFLLVKNVWSQVEAEASRNITMFSKVYEQYLN